MRINRASHGHFYITFLDGSWASWAVERSTSGNQSHIPVDDLLIPEEIIWPVDHISMQPVCFMYIPNILACIPEDRELILHMSARDLELNVAMGPEAHTNRQIEVFQQYKLNTRD